MLSRAKNKVQNLIAMTNEVVLSTVRDRLWASECLDVKNYKCGLTRSGTGTAGCLIAVTLTIWQQRAWKG